MGIWYRERLLGRLKALRTLTAILEMLMSEIQYGKSTLPECCSALTERLEEPYKRTFTEIYQEFGNAGGSSFQEIFVRRMELTFQNLPLKGEDEACFLAPFRNHGFQDGHMQMKSLEQSLLRLNDIIRTQNEEQREKCRMAVGLGVMSGLLLIIIMV